MIQPQDLYRAVLHGGDAKAFLLNLYKRNTGELKLEEIRAEEIADMPTMMMPSIPKSPDLSTNELVAIILAPKDIYIDAHGRQCLKIIDVSAHTLELVDLVVERFHRLTGVLPSEIVACPSRSVLLRNRFYFPRGQKPIPFVRDFSFPLDYDILARGKRP